MACLTLLALAIAAALAAAATAKQPDVLPEACLPLVEHLLLPPGASQANVLPGVDHEGPTADKAAEGGAMLRSEWRFVFIGLVVHAHLVIAGTGPVVVVEGPSDVLEGIQPPDLRHLLGPVVPGPPLDGSGSVAGCLGRGHGPVLGRPFLAVPAPDELR